MATHTKIKGAGLAAQPAAAGKLASSRAVPKAAVTPLAAGSAKALAKAPKTASTKAATTGPTKAAKPAKPVKAAAAATGAGASRAKKPPAPAKPAKAAKPVKPVKTTKTDKSERAPKPVKAKLVRDSFTMPQADFDLVAVLKTRTMGFKRATKKSELLRAGLHALQALDDTALGRALDALVPLKPGRPKNPV